MARASAFRSFTIVLILLVTGCVSSFTLVNTLRCFSTFSATGRSATIHMVLTGGNGVGTATWRESRSGTSNDMHKNAYQCITQRTDRCGSHKGLQRPVRAWSRNPRQQKGSRHCIYYLTNQYKALTHPNFPDIHIILATLLPAVNINM